MSRNDRMAYDMKISVILPTLKKEFELLDFLSNNEIFISRSRGRAKYRNDEALRCKNNFIIFIDNNTIISEETYRKYIIVGFQRFPNMVVSYESPVL